MRVAIVGYGRMGHRVEEVCRERGHDVAVCVDPHAADADAQSLAEAASDGRLGPGMVAIDFSLPDAVAANLAAYGRIGCHAVIGTSGWDESLLEPLRDEGRIGVVHGSNFSVGAQWFTRVVAFAAQLSDRVGGYDPALVEFHHRGKQDSPSGTALMLAREVLARTADKRTIQTETLHRLPERHELHVVSGRAGSIPGTHTVLFDSEADTVELTHRARNRGGFALGAVMAAEWITDRTGIFPASRFFDEFLGAAPETKG